jgi:hypothetical protein
VLISDGNHLVLDHTDFSDGTFNSPALNLNNINDFNEIITKVPKEKREEYEKLLKKLDLKKFGVVLDLTLADDHEQKKDLSVWSIKAMSGGFYKSLSQFPTRMIILIGLCTFFLGISMAFLFEVLMGLVILLLWILFH